MRYQQAVGGGLHTVETTIVIRGERHLRAHRVTLDPATPVPLAAVEGPAALGYGSGERPVISSDTVAGWEGAAAGERAMVIARLRGYDGQRRAASWQGRDDLNSVFGHAVLPLVTVAHVQRGTS